MCGETGGLGGHLLLRLSRVAGQTKGKKLSSLTKLHIPKI